MKFRLLVIDAATGVGVGIGGRSYAWAGFFCALLGGVGFLAALAGVGAAGFLALAAFDGTGTGVFLAALVDLLGAGTGARGLLPGLGASTTVTVGGVGGAVGGVGGVGSKGSACTAMSWPACSS